MSNDYFAKEGLSKLSSAELHRRLREYRWVYTVFSQIGGVAKTKVKSIQSLLMRRGEPIDGKAIEPENMRHPPPTGTEVTDHAILRYLERVKGVDIEGVAAEMKTRIAAGKSYYSGAVVVDEQDICYVLRKDGLVVSVMPRDWMEEADGVKAEVALRRQKTERKDAHYRNLAAQGFDTTPRTTAA